MKAKKSSITLKNKKAYYFISKGEKENYNFHDYFEEDYKKHFVIEGGWDDKFLSIVEPDIKALSIGGIESDIDVDFILNFFPNIKQLFIRCNSIVNYEALFNLKHLKNLSFCCRKNRAIKFELPNSLESLVVDWKSKYSIDGLPSDLKYFSIEGGLELNWVQLFKESKNLVKVDIANSDIQDCSILLSLPKLKYMALTKCKKVNFFNVNSTNISVKYIHLVNVELGNIDWLNKLNGIDILILEGCGIIKDILSLRNKLSLRGLWISGNTKMINGDLSVLDTLINLRNCYIAPFKHYSHKSTATWNWEKFEGKKSQIIERKK